MKIKIFYLFITSILIIAGCKKEDTDPSDILTSKTWKYANADKNMSTNPEGQNTYNLVQTCELDDTFTFKLDGTLVVNRNSVKCSANDSTIVNKTYSIDRKAKTLTINGVQFFLAEESTTQIKYYKNVPVGTSFNNNVIFLLQ